MTTHVVLLALALASIPESVQPTAQSPNEPDPSRHYDSAAFERVDADFIQTDGYLASHPDQWFRLLGDRARQQGRLEQARAYFLRAARYADKLSQGALAEMYWNGEGGEGDRARAYAWMDLAAERGAPLLLAHRERYWSQLTPAERTRALREGEAVYAEYGDAVAKPRLAKKLHQGRMRVTGSRAGWVGHLSICLDPGPEGCQAAVTGEQYYADRHWRPEKYWEWQDRILFTPAPKGKVKIGPLEPVREKGAGK